VAELSAKRGLYVPPFDELSDPRLLAELAAAAEQRGWEGFFVWDHVNYRPPTRAVADPWIALSACATATNSMRLGPMVTPISRRRVQKLARETVTLDHLSDGRLVLGVGLGSDRNGELEPFGEVVDPPERARLLDEGLDRLAGFWGGEFEPIPVQRPRIPVWVAGRFPKRAPIKRAARWDGFFPIDLAGPESLAEVAAELARIRERPAEGFDLVVEISAGEDPAPWIAAGATWCLTSFDRMAGASAVRDAIAAGPDA
jgi:alkanesulfonate monooxygenase SsuD/methylene tetrahydromethanopterin reductase-like flavin-dependent oxidoreductase (luciferase family)